MGDGRVDGEDPEPGARAWRYTNVEKLVFVLASYIPHLLALGIVGVCMVAACWFIGVVLPDARGFMHTVGRWGPPTHHLLGAFLGGWLCMWMWCRVEPIPARRSRFLLGAASLIPLEVFRMVIVWSGFGADALIWTSPIRLLSLALAGLGALAKR